MHLTHRKATACSCTGLLEDPHCTGRLFALACAHVRNAPEYSQDLLSFQSHICKQLLQGHWEKPPYNNSSIRSAYHVRELDVYRLLQIHRHLDVFLSHDWPRGIAHHGNKAQLFRAKPFLRREVIAAPVLFV